MQEPAEPATAHSLCEMKIGLGPSEIVASDDHRRLPRLRRGRPRPGEAHRERGEELQQQTAIEIEPQSFTHRVAAPFQSPGKLTNCKPEPLQLC